jgi:predicted ester cyclase
MSDANKQLVQRWFDEVWNQGNPASIDELFLPDGKAYGFPEPSAILTGPAEFKQAHALFQEAFSDISVEVNDILSEGDHAAARWTVTVTHTGQALGFAPTGKRATFSGSSFLIIRDGKISDGWNHMDFTRVVLELQASSLPTKTKS